MSTTTSTIVDHCNNQKIIIFAVAGLGALCILMGGVLTFKGYNAELLVGGGTASIAGLLGVLSNRPPQQQPDVTFSAGPPATATVSAPKLEEKKPESEPSTSNLI